MLPAIVEDAIAAERAAPPVLCAPFYGMAGSNPRFLAVLEEARRMAVVAPLVLITGGEGAGKRMLARAIHAMGPCAKRPLFEIEGARLSAHHFDLPPAPNTSRTGTLLIRHISRASLEAQQALAERLATAANFLRAQYPRIIVTECLDPNITLHAGTGPRELWQALCAAHLHLPRLAERREDVAILAQSFLRTERKRGNTPAREISSAALRRLESHDWPENVRELENVVITAAAQAPSSVIELNLIDALLPAPGGEPSSSWTPLPLREIERRHIEKMLRFCGGNRVRAARLLGIGRTSLYRFLSRPRNRAVRAEAHP